MKILKSIFIIVIFCLNTSNVFATDFCPLETGGSIVVSGDILSIMLPIGDAVDEVKICTFLFECQFLELSSINSETNTYNYYLSSLGLPSGIYVVSVITTNGNVIKATVYI